MEAATGAMIETEVYFVTRQSESEEEGVFELTEDERKQLKPGINLFWRDVP